MYYFKCAIWVAIFCLFSPCLAHSW